MTEIGIFQRCSTNAPPNFKSQMLEQRSYVICSFIPYSNHKKSIGYQTDLFWSRYERNVV